MAKEKDENVVGVVKCAECGGSLTIIETEDGGLGCIPFEGPEKNLLTGYTKMRNGEVRYIGYGGQIYNREEALAKFGRSEVAHQDAKMRAAEGMAIKLGRR